MSPAGSIHMGCLWLIADCSGCIGNYVPKLCVWGRMADGAAQGTHMADGAAQGTHELASGTVLELNIPSASHRGRCIADAAESGSAVLDDRAAR